MLPPLPQQQQQRGCRKGGSVGAVVMMQEQEQRATGAIICEFPVELAVQCDSCSPLCRPWKIVYVLSVGLLACAGVMRVLVLKIVLVV